MDRNNGLFTMCERGAYEGLRTGGPPVDPPAADAFFNECLMNAFRTVRPTCGGQSASLLNVIVIKLTL